MKKIHLKDIEVIQTICIEYEKINALKKTVTKKATIFILRDLSQIGLRLKNTAIFDSLHDKEIPKEITCGIPSLRTERYPLSSLDDYNEFRVIILKGEHWILHSRKKGESILLRRKKKGEKSDYKKDKDLPEITEKNFNILKMVDSVGKGRKKKKKKIKEND